jgi:hypothetical protein
MKLSVSLKRCGTVKEMDQSGNSMAISMHQSQSSPILTHSETEKRGLWIENVAKT